jgi:asparagine synthase (glutamine-hydrolysing)
LHAFAIAVGLPNVSSERLAAAVGEVGRRSRLDSATAWRVDSDGGSLAAAGVHHGAVAAPRRYVSRDGATITLFDGLPVDHAGHRAHDAAELARGWELWARDLEGQFCAARIDLERERAELLLDSFGLMPVFLMREGGGALASNSVQVIRTLLKPSAPDPLGVSTMLGLGWASRRHTLLRDVRALAGGATHVLESGRIGTRIHFGPADIDRRAGADTSADELAQYMATLTESAVRDIEPVRCAITAGRDSRLLLALLRARGLAGDYYTIGRPEDADVVWARALAERFGFPHRLLVPEEDDPQLDWTRMAAEFIAQTDGLSNLGQLIDYLEFASAPESIGVKLWGIGAEIGRAGPGDTPITAANMPLLGHSLAIQRRVLAMKADAYRNLMTADAQQILDQSVDRFAADRRAEGWHVNEIADLFFTFERVGCHGATGPRRAAAADDLFSPYCSRRYAEYCLALSPAERYVELPYHRLLSRLAPELYDYPFEVPLRPAQSWRAGPRAARKLARVAAARAGLGGSGAEADAGARLPFAGEWFEQRLELMRELFAHEDSPLWDFVARERVHALLAADPEERRPQLDGLLRAATAFWYFHGARPS